MILGIATLYLLFAAILGVAWHWDRMWLIACLIGAALFALIAVLTRVSP